MRKSEKANAMTETTTEKQDYGFLKIVPQLRENKVPVQPNLQFKKQLIEDFKQIFGF